MHHLKKKNASRISDLLNVTNETWILGDTSRKWGLFDKGFDYILSVLYDVKLDVACFGDYPSW